MCPVRKRKRDFVVSGKKFSTLKELSMEAGISYQAAVKRVDRGWSDEEIFYGREKKRSKGKSKSSAGSRSKPITVNGAKYRSFNHAYEFFKPSCSVNTARARLRYGWTNEQVFDVTDRIDGRKAKGRAKRLIVDGRQLNAKQASEEFGVSYSTVLSRLRKGATARQALGLEEIEPGDLVSKKRGRRGSKKKEIRELLVDGIPFVSVPALARAYDVSAGLVYNRMHRGWSAERSVKETVGVPVTVQGVVYRSAMHALERVGETSLSTYQGRRKMGFPLLVCLGLEPLPNQGRYEVHGEQYSALSEVARAYGLNVGQLNGRLKIMPLEEAVVYQPSNGRYTRSSLDSNLELAKSNGVLYFVKIHFPEGDLHKVGITRKSTALRLAQFKHSVIFEQKGRLVNIFEVEQNTKKKFAEMHCRAEEDFDGRTETFLLTDEQESQMLDYIKDSFEITEDGGHLKDSK